MRFKRLDLNLLVALDAVLVEKSTTRAGERLHLSQSTVSDALARLRTYFNDELLVQVGRKMTPTPLGDSLVKPVRDILLQVEATLNIRPTFDPATSSRKFKLMLSDYVATVLMTEAIPKIQVLAPHVTFELLPQSLVSSPSDTLDRGDIDFLIIPQDFVAPGHPSDTLFQDDFICVVWNENPLIGNSVSLDQYLSMGHLVAMMGGAGTPSIDEWFHKRFGAARRIELVTMNFNSVPQLIVGTTRVATMHKRLAHFYARYLPIKLLPLPLEMPTLTEAIQWHKFFDLDPGIAWIKNILKEVANTQIAS